MSLCYTALASNRQPSSQKGLTDSLYIGIKRGLLVSALL